MTIRHIDGKAGVAEGRRKLNNIRNKIQLRASPATRIEKDRGKGGGGGRKISGSRILKVLQKGVLEREDISFMKMRQEERGKGVVIPINH